MYRQDLDVSEDVGTIPFQTRFTERVGGRVGQLCHQVDTDRVRNDNADQGVARHYPKFGTAVPIGAKWRLYLIPQLDNLFSILGISLLLERPSLI